MSSGSVKMVGDSDGELPIIGTMLMLSVPAAIITSASPTRMRSAAICTADRPEAQKRLTVMPPTLLGRPASTAPMRATFRPCCASGIAQPQITSSMALRVEPRHLRQRGAQRGGQQVVRPGVAEVAAVRAPDGRARGGDDVGFLDLFHGELLGICSFPLWGKAGMGASPASAFNCSRMTVNTPCTLTRGSFVANLSTAKPFARKKPSRRLS